MCKLKPDIKKDAFRRWAIPERVFLRHGVCHILAEVFLRMKPLVGFHAERLVSADECAGN